MKLTENQLIHLLNGKTISVQEYVNPASPTEYVLKSFAVIEKGLTGNFNYNVYIRGLEVARDSTTTIEEAIQGIESIFHTYKKAQG